MPPIDQLGKSKVALPKSEPEVRYVLSGQATGWTAMAKEVRDFDEEKVQDCKEDIDTLLVFVSIHLLPVLP